MIIGIDASRANRSHKSGTEWYSYYLIRALARLDGENTYILYTDKPLTGGMADLTMENAPTEPSFTSDGFQEIKSPHGNFKGKVLSWPSKFFWTQGRLSLEMLLHRPDVLFVPAHALPLIHPKRSVVTIHDIGFRYDEKLYEAARIGAESRRRRNILDFIVRFLSRGALGANTRDYLEWSTAFSLKKASRIIAVSEFTKQEIASVYATPEAKLVVVPHGYNSTLYRPIADEAGAERALARYNIREPYLFYVGRLEKKKNTATLIEAFALLKESRKNFPYKLYLIGDASYGFDDIKYTIHEFSMEKDVIATGWAAEEDLPYIYSRASAFVFPSNYEGFGIPLLQAMATKTPIAASKAASIPEVAGDAAEYFDPKDPRDMAEAMGRVLEDEPLRVRLIDAGTRRVAAYGWDRCARETLDVLKSA